MGDGAAQYIAAVNKALTKLGPDYRAEVVGAVGYSRGEDAFMGPAEWKDTPEAAKGGLVAGVLRDGDWNIAQDWLRKNDIKNNPDERTTIRRAQLGGTDDYIKAAEMYITHGVLREPCGVVTARRRARRSTCACRAW
jgi:OOP family OmpA-OmpF porin